MGLGGTLMRRLWSYAIILATFVCATSVANARPRHKGGGGDKGMEFEPDGGGGAPPSATLQRATKDYDKHDYYSASIELKKVLDGETQDDAANKQRAEFFMGKALYKMGYYAGALAYFDKITQAGDKHAYHAATLKWLAALSQVLPETSGILDKIGTYDPSALDDPSFEDVRDQLYYLLGRHFYRKGGDGDFDTAISLFEKVRPNNPFYMKAKFFEGVTYVRKLDGKNALESFKAILVIGRERPKSYDPREIDKFEKLATLQMARVFYSAGDFEKSIRYYEKLDQDSPDWTASLFEASWAYFMITNNSKALGNIHTLNAPYFEDEFWPESVLLKAVIYYKYCLYDRAIEAIGEYDQKFRPLRKDLQGVIAKYEDNAEFYAYIKKIMAGKAGLNDVTQRLVMSVLVDKTLHKTFAWVDELQKELDMLNKSDKSWQTTQIAAEVLAELTLQKSLAEADAGKLARERIKRLIGELREFSRDGIKIKIEILNAQAEGITAKARKESISRDHKEEPIIVDDEHFMWKFNGEYWKDELGYYRFKIRSRCPKK
jgi:tetratricopeptide (TPR) repeat protein